MNEGGGMEAVKTKRKVQAFPPSLSSRQNDKNHEPKWGYVKIANVPMGVQDELPPNVQDYLGSTPSQTDTLGQTRTSAFPQEQLRRTGVMCSDGDPVVYGTYAYNNVDLRNPEAAPDMELEMVD